MVVVVVLLTVVVVAVVMVTVVSVVVVGVVVGEVVGVVTVQSWNPPLPYALMAPFIPTSGVGRKRCQQRVDIQ
jgi:hypothetical protein